MLMCRSLGPSSELFVIIWHCQLYMDTAWNSLCNQVSHSTVLQSPLFCFEYKYCRSWCDNNGMEGWKTFPENMNVTAERRGCFSEWKKERERTHLTALQAEGEMVSFLCVCVWVRDRYSVPVHITDERKMRGKDFILTLWSNDNIKTNRGSYNCFCNMMGSLVAQSTVWMVVTRDDQRNTLFTSAKT